jgi:hypothetical protein
VDLKVANWNTGWRTPKNAAGRRIAAILDTSGSDIIVVTEGVRDLLPAHGHTVDAGPDWGYSLEVSRRKVIIWSRFPLKLDFVGLEGATRGRLAVATAETPAGPVRIVGVCIPWRDAHVSTGRSDAQPWSEHSNFLDHLEPMLPTLNDDIPTVIAGDFNQRIPRDRQPLRVADRLNAVLADWTIHTAGALPNGPHIDHIATNRRLLLESVDDWPASDHLGRLSDHAGVVCRLTYAQQSIRGAGADSASERGRLEPEYDDALTPDGTLISDDTLTSDGPPISDRPPALDSSLTLEVQTEIEGVLRRSGDGLSHGATFRLREQGLGDAEIAAVRKVSVSATRVFLRSLDALLSGTLPTSKSAALTNSYVYRELLNHHRSDSLDSYVKAQLRKLKTINPVVSFDPLQTRTHQYRVGERN